MDTGHRGGAALPKRTRKFTAIIGMRMNTTEECYHCGRSMKGLVSMSAQNSLLHHLQQLTEHPNVEPETSIHVEATLTTGKDLTRPLHAIFNDGIAIMERKKVIYVPLAGLASLTLHHPGYSKD